MKIDISSWFQQMTGETFATFGAARLVRHLDGRFELIGGTPADHATAREWCSLFAPTIVFPAHLERPARAGGSATGTGCLNTFCQKLTLNAFPLAPPR